MLVLFETASGFAIFKVLNEQKLKSVENLFSEFTSPEKAAKMVQLKSFRKFRDNTESLAATLASVEGKLSKPLRKLLKKVVVPEMHEQLAVADAALGKAIKEKLKVNCVADNNIQELMRCIRSQMDSLISELGDKERTAMALGLAHNLGRYTLKFSPDKVDTMIIQAISLLDDLDKELNNYNMRAREWYGWHFPELSRLIPDHLTFVKTIKLMGDRVNAASTDFSAMLPDEIAQQVKDAAEISMGTEVSEGDILNIGYLCDQVIEITLYRTQLQDYLKNRMLAIAPNVCVLVGEQVGARLISHAGSLVNLAKHAASTVQILGAEKALFRALKTKHATPKYGLMYHAQLISQATPKNKGKIARTLANKVAIAARVDALADEPNYEFGAEHRAKLEKRLRDLEGGGTKRISGLQKSATKYDKYTNKSELLAYNPAADNTLGGSQKKRKLSETDTTPVSQAKKPKIELSLSTEKDVLSGSPTSEISSEKRKKKKSHDGTPAVTPALSLTSTEKKKKKKKNKEVLEMTLETSPKFSTEKKKKKKLKVESEDVDISVKIEPGSEKKKLKVETGDVDVSVKIDPGSEKKKKHRKSAGEGLAVTSKVEAGEATPNSEKKKKKRVQQEEESFTEEKTSEKKKKKKKHQNDD